MFEASDNVLTFGTLELDYGSILYGENLKIEANQIELQPGSLMDLVGTGHNADLGPGAGVMVS